MTEDDAPLRGPAYIARRPKRDEIDMDPQPIADLCRPLSAMVLPRSALFSNSGHERKESVALNKQRMPKNARGSTRTGKRI